MHDRRRLLQRVAWVVLAALTVIVVGVGPPASAATADSAGSSVGASTPLLPSADPFYRYTGTRPLALVAPGTVLATRSVTLTDAPSGSPLEEQLEYRTTDEVGQPVVSVTTVLTPGKVSATSHLVAYLSFYDALGAQCDPSYTLRGGNPGSADAQTAGLERAVVSSLGSQGDVVTVPDFEDPSLDFLAGPEAGQSTLDSIQATESYLHMASATKVGLIGYSGGSVAAEWASELAPAYAPALDLVGVAEGGLPVDPVHNLAYINGSTQWAGVIPAALVGMSRAFGFSLMPYLSAYGRQVITAVGSECLGAFTGNYPRLTLASLVLPRYRDLTAVPMFAAVLNKLVMGTGSSVPAEPLLMVVGKSDATGDGVMVTADVTGLAQRYCSAHVSVDLEVLNGLNHTAAAVAFLPLAFSFLTTRFDGATAKENCAGDASSSAASSTRTATPQPTASEVTPAGSISPDKNDGLSFDTVALATFGGLAVAVIGFVGWQGRRRRRRRT